jgi:hypothetical protein
MSDASTLDLQTVRGDVVIEVEITITDPSGDYASTASTSHGGSIRIEERR